MLSCRRWSYLPSQQSSSDSSFHLELPHMDLLANYYGKMIIGRL
jgi:hypothetical protein